MSRKWHILCILSPSPTAPYQGRWEPFIARHNVSGDFAGEGGAAYLLHLAVVCAEDVPRMTPELMKEDAALLTRALAERMPALCKSMNVPAVPYAAPAQIETPVNLTKEQSDLLKQFVDAGGGSTKHSPESDGFFTKVREFWDDLKD